MIVATQIIAIALVTGSIIYLLIFKRRMSQEQSSNIVYALRKPKLIIHVGLAITIVACLIIVIYSLSEPSSYDSFVIYSLLTLAFVGMAIGCYGVIASTYGRK